MPFKSENQRRYLWMHEPKVAARWSKKYGSKPVQQNDMKGNVPKKGVPAFIQNKQNQQKPDMRSEARKSVATKRLAMLKAKKGK